MNFVRESLEGLWTYLKGTPRTLAFWVPTMAVLFSTFWLMQALVAEHPVLIWVQIATLSVDFAMVLMILAGPTNETVFVPWALFMISTSILVGISIELVVGEISFIVGFISALARVMILLFAVTRRGE